jgi:hypothetical protein
MDFPKFKEEIDNYIATHVSAEVERAKIKTNVYFLTKEVCDIFRVTPQTLNHWHKTGKLCYSKAAGERSNNLYSIDDVNALHEILKREREQNYRFRNN